MTANLTPHRLAMVLAGLSLLLACSGGGGGGGNSGGTPPSTTASGLDYSAAGGGSYAVVKNAAKSTSTKLVLDLQGPASTAVAGVAWVFTADTTKVSWVKVDDTDVELVQNAGFAPTLVVAKARQTGNELQVGLFHKGGQAIGGTGTVVLGRIALQLKPGLGLTPNTPVTFGVVSGKTSVLNTSGTPYSSVSVSVGALTAR